MMAACQKEMPRGKDREVEIRITTGTTLAGAKTRAPGTEAEENINKVAVLVFDNSNTATPDNHDDALFVRSTYAWKKSSGLYSAILEVGDDLDIYFAINAEDVVADGLASSGPNGGAAVPGVTTYGEIKEKLIMSGNSPSNVGVNGLPMWGYRHNEQIQANQSNSFGVVKVLRAVAAADVTVTASNFSFVNLSARNVSSQGYLAYNTEEDVDIDFATGDDPNAPQQDYKLLKPYVPGGTTTVANLSVNDPSSTVVGGVTHQKMGTLYFYENDKDDTAATESKKYTKIVIGGKYDPLPDDPSNDAGLATTYYPLAFRDRNENQQNTNDRAQLIRNTKFIFTVSNVNGPGFDTPEEAENSEDQNIDYDVIQWDEWDDGDIMTWGSYWLSVAKSRNEDAKGTEGEMKYASLYRNKSSDDLITFNTNTDVNGWTFDLTDKNESHTYLYEEEVRKGLRAGETLLAAPRIANAFYEVYVIKGTTTGTGKDAKTPGRFVFVALQDYAERVPSVLTVTSGGIVYDINVRQTNTSPQDWAAGGEHDWNAGEKE